MHLRPKFCCYIVIAAYFILFFTMLYLQKYSNANPVSVPILRKSNILTAEEPRLSFTEIWASISTQCNISTVEEPVWGKDHIMFLETSCILKGGREKTLLPRQICSIESAAKINPARKVYVLHSCPLSAVDHGIGLLCTKYNNVKFWPLNLELLMPASPLEGWDYKTRLFLSEWPQGFGNNIARFLVLWNYGGTCFDTDLMLLRELSGVTKENFLSEGALGSAALRFLIHNNAGHHLLRTVMMQIKNSFGGWEQTLNGSGALQRAVAKLCITTKKAILPSSCFGVNLLSPKYFFEIPFSEWKMFFDEYSTPLVMQRLKDSYGVHFWNKLSHGTKVMVGSRQAYAILAQEHCPHLYASVNTSF